MRLIPNPLGRTPHTRGSILLAAHLVPGYFAAVASQSQWQPVWNKKQLEHTLVAALASTVIPDSDVIYNWLFRGFFHHSTLWTHSLFVHLGIGLCWWSLRRIRRWPYLQMLMGLVALSGLSHLVLDVVSHSTPLFYPLSLYMVGAPSTRVLEGGVLGYMTDPIFLSEPLFLAVVYRTLDSQSKANTASHETGSVRIVRRVSYF